jgi:hypothetical protein
MITTLNHVAQNVDAQLPMMIQAIVLNIHAAIHRDARRVLAMMMKTTTIVHQHLDHEEKRIIAPVVIGGHALKTTTLTTEKTAHLGVEILDVIHEATVRDTRTKDMTIMTDVIRGIRESIRGTRRGLVQVVIGRNKLPQL